MAVDMSLLVADKDYSEPWDTADPGGLFSGLGGLAATLPEVGRRIGRPELVESAFTRGKE